MMSCCAFYGVYMMSAVSVMFLYPSRNGGGPHRICTLYTRVTRLPRGRGDLDIFTYRDQRSIFFGF